MALLMAAMWPQMLAGVVLNDIGPEIDPTGAARISIVCRPLAAGTHLGRCRCTDEDDVRPGDALNTPTHSGSRSRACRSTRR
jgi:hypothetical protein